MDVHNIVGESQPLSKLHLTHMRYAYRIACDDPLKCTGHSNYIHNFQKN